ncbi:MAG TPA: TetR family transcriptional regulator [Pseudonocardia sp.]|jgi:AcrR family transcriptional regulator
MVEGSLTSEDVLEATELVLRRYGPAKATVVDVARALKVSHGSVYRHFPSKAALREAVTRRWLDRAHARLAGIAEADGPAADRIREWLVALFEAKRRKALDDPELFATYSVLGRESSTVVDEHVHGLVDQLRTIIEQGVAAGEFAADDPERAAGAVFAATARFHDPVHASSWAHDGAQREFEAVCELVLAGLGAGRR